MELLFIYFTLWNYLKRTYYYNKLLQKHDCLKDPIIESIKNEIQNNM